ncbi:hypothetical protein ISCGN_014705 [Ixodes scapularis]
MSLESSVKADVCGSLSHTFFAHWMTLKLFPRKYRNRPVTERAVKWRERTQRQVPTGAWGAERGACIVSERGCWQKPLALYLQRHLSSIDLPHPYRVRDSLEVIDYLTTKHADHDLNLFSLDIEDMYYNLDLKILLNSVSEAIEMHGVTSFQNASGIPTGGFLDLLRLYLRSSLVEYEGEIFIQRSGVCIGSCLAPILSEIFLFFVDRAVQEDLARSGSGCRIFRPPREQVRLPGSAIDLPSTDQSLGLGILAPPNMLTDAAWVGCSF